MKKLILCLFLITSFFINFGLTKEIVFRKQRVLINGVELQVEVAETDQERQLGLMHRKNLNKGDGMLFKLGEIDSMPCFWMKNTHIPLSLAFVNKDYFIVQIESLTPDTTQFTCAEHPVRYALEVPQNWFNEKKIGIGAKVKGVNRLIP